jgi:hypothetical protein
MNEDRKDLRALAKRVPPRYIKKKPGGFEADYVSHSEIQQMLLAKLSVPPSQEIRQVITNTEGVVHGCVLRVVYVIDGETVVVEEAGDCERPQANNGANLKNAVSDAVKRCAMRVGLGLELWSQENYVLDQALEPKDDATDE